MRRAPDSLGGPLALIASPLSQQGYDSGYALQVKFLKCGVCVDVHREEGGGIYRSEWNLHRLGEVGLASGGGRPTNRVERPPPTFSTDSGFSSLYRRVATKSRAEPPQTLAGQSTPGAT
jgi:hypothetical protein